MTLVRIDTLEPWLGEALPHTTNKAKLHRLDGTVEDVEVTPYTFDVRHPANIGDVWTDEELRAAGLVRPVPFAAPKGMRAVGDVRFESIDGVIATVFDLEEIPPAPEPVVLSPEERLARAGLTPNDLKALLAKAD